MPFGTYLQLLICTQLPPLGKLASLRPEEGNTLHSPLVSLSLTIFLSPPALSPARQILPLQPSVISPRTCCIYHAPGLCALPGCPPAFCKQ